jgi:Aldehyde dehydrogenase family
VKPVVRVNGEEEAIRVANDTEYGLSAAVFGRDVQRALQVAKRIESGICHIKPDGMTRRKCRSAASRPPAMAASAARPSLRSSPTFAGSPSKGRSNIRSDLRGKVRGTASVINIDGVLGAIDVGQAKQGGK